MNDSQIIYDFISLAIESGGWMRLDRAFLQNKLADMVGCGETIDYKNQVSNLTAEELCQELVKIAKKNKPSVYQTNEDMDRLAQSILDLLTPPPSVVNAMFAKKFESSPTDATNYLYWLNQINGYLSGGKQEIGTEDSLCPLCFKNEGAYVSNSAFLKKTRRFIRLNLDNTSWGYQLNPMEKNKEVGLFFAEEHTYLFMNSYLINKMIAIVDLYTHYELKFSESYYFDGHSYILGHRVKKGREIECHQILPFFKDSFLSYNSLEKNELVIRTSKHNDLWMILSYVFSLTVSLKKGLYTKDFTYYLLKTEKDYQLVVILSEEISQKATDNWLYTMELLSNELEVRY
ncbi:hypothetical protein JNUCC83_03075 [Vagococcus sp. JNUCC 83]